MVILVRFLNGLLRSQALSRASTRLLPAASRPHWRDVTVWPKGLCSPRAFRGCTGQAIEYSLIPNRPPDYFTPTVMAAELLAVLLSVPLKVTWPVADIVPVVLNVTPTVTTSV